MRRRRVRQLLAGDLPQSPPNYSRPQMLAEWPFCAYCLAPLDRRTVTVEHVIPRSRGGGVGPENVVCACVACNQDKNDRGPVEFLLDLLGRASSPACARACVS